MTTTMTQDILDLLEADHREAERQLLLFDTPASSEREELFCRLVHILVAHEVAEEVVVYPRIRNDAPDGPAEADPGSRSKRKLRRSWLPWRSSTRAMKPSCIN